jgi:hypothetical protein
MEGINNVWGSLLYAPDAADEPSGTKALNKSLGKVNTQRTPIDRLLAFVNSFLRQGLEAWLPFDQPKTRPAEIA